jgi:hypothetical protein
MLLHAPSSKPQINVFKELICSHRRRVNRYDQTLCTYENSNAPYMFMQHTMMNRHIGNSGNTAFESGHNAEPCGTPNRYHKKH